MEKNSKYLKELTSTPEQFDRQLENAERIFQSWPEWKRETPSTSYPRPSMADE